MLELQKTTQIIKNAIAEDLSLKVIENCKT